MLLTALTNVLVQIVATLVLPIVTCCEPRQRLEFATNAFSANRHASFECKYRLASNGLQKVWLKASTDLRMPSTYVTNLDNEISCRRTRQPS